MVHKLNVVLVRHGETDSNVNRILQGSLNTSLNKNGKGQALEAAKALKDRHFDRAYCSSLERCVQTAEPIVSGRAMRTSYSRELWEKDLGDLEGMQYLDARTKMKNEDKDIDDYGEGQAAFTQRLLAFWDSQVLAYASETEGPESMLIVTHGGCIATLGRTLAARGYEQAPGHNGQYVVPRNCSFTEIEIVVDGDYHGKFLRFGEASHISSSHETLVGVDTKIGKEEETES